MHEPAPEGSPLAEKVEDANAAKLVEDSLLPQPAHDWRDLGLHFNVESRTKDLFNFWFIVNVN